MYLQIGEWPMKVRASRALVAFFVVGVLGLTAVPARAQSFGFSIASGGHGHGHHHHHCHGGGWSFGYGFGPVWAPAYYAPPTVVYAAPPPVVKERVIYVQPQTPAVMPANPYSSNTAPSGSLASSSGPSVAGSSSNDDRIVIRNAAGAQLPVSFLVDGQDVELSEGGTRTFVGRTQRVIQYDRGGRFGSTQQELTGGQYEFRITASGWDLVRRPDVVPSSRTAVRANSLPEANVR
jgi:hypothetical protein